MNIYGYQRKKKSARQVLNTELAKGSKKCDAKVDRLQKAINRMSRTIKSMKAAKKKQVKS